MCLRIATALSFEYCAIILNESKAGDIMDNEDIKQLIHDLRLEHKDLDDAINLMKEQAFVDELQIQRLKKRKLLLKDEIQKLESKLIPDIEA